MSTPTWVFWLPDSDRSTGWTNHGYVLQYVCEGVGEDAEAAWQNADVPEGFSLPESLVAIRQDAEEPFTGGMQIAAAARRARAAMDDGLNALIRDVVSAEVGRPDWPGDVDPLTAGALSDALEAVLAQLIENGQAPK